MVLWPRDVAEGIVRSGHISRSILEVKVTGFQIEKN